MQDTILKEYYRMLKILSNKFKIQGICVNQLVKRKEIPTDTNKSLAKCNYSSGQYFNNTEHYNAGNKISSRIVKD